jgi:hypothetical protein
VLGDAGRDPKCTFEDLGNAVRKIRIDMGVPITFRGTIAIRSRDAADAATAGRYCAIGEIDYQAIDGPGAVNGVLLYVKPAFYGSEPADVYNYAKGCEDFPHESTADQFFSESQFESYRALGEYIVRELVAKPLTSSHIDVKGNRLGSLLSHWSDLLRASDSSVQIPATESGVWPTAVEKMPEKPLSS